MSAPKSIAYARLAHADLASISKYTKDEWGAAQRDRYLALIRSGIYRLVDFPELGEPHPELGANIRTIRIEMHNVYYRATPKTIRILRIRHVRNHPLSVNEL